MPIRAWSPIEKKKKAMTQSRDEEQKFLSHLIELRQRFIYILVVSTAIFVVLLPFSNQVYLTFARPVLSSLLEGQMMLAQDGIDIFLTPIKVCLFIAVLISMPHTLYQIWAYLKPALLEHEKRLAFPLILSATILFYLGVLFAYFVILPIMFQFFSGIELEGVSFMPDITRYLSISIAMFIAFGVVFEIPIALILLVMMGVLDPDKLSNQRPYVILIAFTVGMLLTPPDMISQTLLAVPMIIMFEIGLLIAKRLKPKE